MILTGRISMQIFTHTLFLALIFPLLFLVFNQGVWPQPGPVVGIDIGEDIG